MELVITAVILYTFYQRWHLLGFWATLCVNPEEKTFMMETFQWRLLWCLLQYPYETLFRSQHYALLDNGCREFLFLSDFFMVAGNSALDLFNNIMGKTLSLFLVWQRWHFCSTSSKPTIIYYLYKHIKKRLEKMLNGLFKENYSHVFTSCCTLLLNPRDVLIFLNQSLFFKNDFCIRS